METMNINSSEISKDNNFNMSAKFHIEKKKEEIQKILNNLSKVENMKSPNGNDTPNPFIIRGRDDGFDFALFQSYDSPIVLDMNNKIYIFKDWDYSTTTGKYRNQFLNETKRETLAKLKSGEYIAVDFDTSLL